MYFKRLGRRRNGCCVKIMKNVLKTLRVLKKCFCLIFPGGKQKKSTQNPHESGKNGLDDTPPTGSGFF